MSQRARLLLLVVLLGVVLCAPTARAEDPPRVDILATLHLEPLDGASGLVSANHLEFTVREGSPLTVFAAGDLVNLISFGRGSFHVVHARAGLSACCVIERVHLLDFLSPRRALVALGLEPSDDPISDGARLPTRVADPERLAAHGIACDGVGALVSVYGRTSGRWSISTFGREPGSVEVDAWAFYAPRAPLGDTLARASVVLDLGTLPEGGRLLARVAEPARLEPLGIRGMPSGDFVHLTRGSGSAWTLTTLSPGFTVAIELPALDPEAFVPAGLGLEPPRLLDLPIGGSVQGRLKYSWKAAKEGLKGARARDRMEVVRQEDGSYLLRDLEPRRPVSIRLSDA